MMLQLGMRATLLESSMRMTPAEHRRPLIGLETEREDPLTVGCPSLTRPRRCSPPSAGPR